MSSSGECVLCSFIVGLIMLIILSTWGKKLEIIKAKQRESIKAAPLQENTWWKWMNQLEATKRQSPYQAISEQDKESLSSNTTKEIKTFLGKKTNKQKTPLLGQSKTI